jgi:hypothetical protein
MDLVEMVRRALDGDQDAIEELGLDLEDLCHSLCDEVERLRAEVESWKRRYEERTRWT